MALIQAPLFVALACLVTAIPQVRNFDIDDGWQLTLAVTSQTNVSDASLKQVAFININVKVYNYNYTQDSFHIVSDTVRRGLSKIEIDSKAPHDSLKVYKGNDAPLPLAYYMVLQEAVSVGPKSNHTVGLVLDVDIYAKKKHRADVLEALKNFSL